MTEDQIKAEINSQIVTNGNNEITAAILNPILIGMVDQINDKTGDLPNLATVDKSNLVNAINELANAESTRFDIYNGTDDPNVTPPATYGVGDWYIQNGDTLYQYNGVEWVTIKNYDIPDTFTIHYGGVDPNITPPSEPYDTGDWYVLGGTYVYQYSNGIWVPIANSQSGLQVIEEAGNTGYRLLNSSPFGRANIGNNAVDLSASNTTDSNAGLGASGEDALASGLNTKATGDQSATIGGIINTASGYKAVVIGSENSVASGLSTVVIGGFSNNATGSYAVASGAYNNVPSFAETGIGLNSTTYTPASATQHNVADRVFNVGVGVSDVLRQDAFTILKSGATGVGYDNFETASTGQKLQVKGIIKQDATIAEINAGDGTTVVNNAYLTDKLGLERLNEGNGFGYRLGEKAPANYGDIGLNAVDLSNSISSSAVNGATGETSFAAGQDTKASGNVSYANGLGVFSRSYGETATGLFSTDYVPTSTTAVNANDRVFNVGNGTANNNRTDAFTILKSGATGIGYNNFEFSKTSEKLQVNGAVKSDITPAQITSGTPKTLITKEYFQVATNAVFAETFRHYAAAQTDPTWSIHTMARTPVTSIDLMVQRQCNFQEGSSLDYYITGNVLRVRKTILAENYLIKIIYTVNVIPF